MDTGTSPITMQPVNIVMHYTRDGVWHSGSLAQCSFCRCECDDVCSTCGKRKV